ncbi:MFS transporter [Leekyejoonella antrihumi]|uniref:MFS transporter n=1 Tax=Leekyejoonella antrihumi TaxID=1660198 RepID=A0A563DTA4_9MICO|nr:MFS transporter [Leekyejoonella antrihumi]TWP33171.1 MFS transporter [Leekyejoonella antrihumi]
MTINVNAKTSDTTLAPQRGHRSPARAWLVTVMLVTLALVNWGDKAVLGLVAVPLMKDLHISPGQYGLLASAVYFLFSLSAVGAGFLANRRSVKWLLFIMVAVWSVTQFSIWLAPAFGMILLSRIILGLAEGPSAGLSFHAAGKWFHDHERNIPIALQNVGAFGGIAVAAPALTWLISEHGWHWAFFAVGAAGLAWMGIWFFIGKDGPYSGESKTSLSGSIFDGPGRVSYRHLLLSRTFIGAVCLGLAAYWALAIVSAWLPAYLRTAEGYTAQHAASIVMEVSLTAIVFLMLQALITHVLMKRGVGSRIARGVMASGSVTIAGLFIMLSATMSAGLAQTVALCVGFGLGLVTFTTGAVFLSEFVPVLQRGAIMGIYVGVITLSGVICPTAFGWIVEGVGAGGYTVALLVSGGLILIGGIAGLILVDPPREAARIATLFEPTP